jgi:hypothetical protein
MAWPWRTTYKVLDDDDDVDDNPLDETAAEVLLEVEEEAIFRTAWTIKNLPDIQVLLIASKNTIANDANS